MAAAHHVVFVAFDGVMALDLVGPMDVFETASRQAPASKQHGGYRLLTVSPGGVAVRAMSGLRIAADAALERFRGRIDTLVVPGGTGARRGAEQPRLIAAIARVAERAKRVVSVCTGSYLLAAAGLLDGRRATTHWAWCEDFTARFPAVSVDPDPIFVRDEAVWTSAGVTSGMDLALALVEEDLGREVALATARRLVLFVQRTGGQSQFSAQLSAQLAESSGLRELTQWILEHPTADLSVEALARRAAMSPRHFARVFRAEVGRTPAAYVESIRIEIARRLLEATALPVDAVCGAAGFRSMPTFRRVFARRLGVNPTSYRTRFRSGAPPWTS